MTDKEYIAALEQQVAAQQDTMDKLLAAQADLLDFGRRAVDEIDRLKSIINDLAQLTEDVLDSNGPSLPLSRPRTTLWTQSETQHTLFSVVGYNVT